MPCAILSQFTEFVVQRADHQITITLGLRLPALITCCTACLASPECQPSTCFTYKQLQSVDLLSLAFPVFRPANFAL
jgi:Na+-translocating ferredoxin:NAD+ oxidoreductase RnfA subunit